MATKPAGYHSLSRRIILQFCLFTLIISAMYGLISFLLMYMLEDTFIEKELIAEARFLRGEYEQTGIWPAARKSNMQMYFAIESFPKDIRALAIEEPQRTEFYGENERHYHVLRFKNIENVYLIAEVSDELMVRKVRKGTIIFLSISGLILTMFACFFGWLIGRKTARPLHELADLVGGMAPEHIPDKFAHQFPNNEVGILARTLEDTFLRINQALEREKHFTRDVSHELRTPLAVIKNALELRQSLQRDRSLHRENELLQEQGLQRESGLQQEQNLQSTGNEQHDDSTENPIIARISEAAEQMDRTVATLLMLAREENTAAQKQPENLMPIIEKAVLDNCILLEGKDVEVNISDNCDTKVSIQAGMFKVLLDNLLSNAFQYTDNGEVRIDFIDNQLVVQDTGRGIDPAISDKITESGIKGKHSTGFGFGLSIVKRLCENQGWQLTVESKNGTKVAVLIGCAK